MVKRRLTFTRVLVVFSYLIMVIVNMLANIIPINGVKTGEVSNSFPNLFAPAGYTFAIWGLIYFLLAGYTLFQLGFFQKYENPSKSNLLEKVGIYFSISSLANALWIFSWHYFLIPLSMLLMTIILVCLIIIIEEIRKERLSLREKIFIKLPFSIYFGWITIATIANATTLFVSLGWRGLGMSEQAWTVVIIALGLVIALITSINNKDIPYGLVIIWAYAGILIKHVSPQGFAWQYPSIIIAAVASLAVMFLTEGYLIARRYKTIA